MASEGRVARAARKVATGVRGAVPSPRVRPRPRRAQGREAGARAPRCPRPRRDAAACVTPRRPSETSMIVSVPFMRVRGARSATKPTSRAATSREVTVSLHLAS